MNLHLSKELFDQAVIMASEAMMINPAIIEKDYYVTYLFKGTGYRGAGYHL